MFSSLWLKRTCPTFQCSVPKLNQLPPTVREIALLGRSNAGKSSAINALTGQTKLAKISKRPGKTQAFVYFHIENGLYLVDLPGYGYASVNHATQAQWYKALPTYCLQRTALAGFVLFMDCRHPLTTLDLDCLTLCQQSKKPVLILLTKADKLSKQQQNLTHTRVHKALSNQGIDYEVALFSVTKKIGLTFADNWILQQLTKSDVSDKSAIEIDKQETKA